ncbi:hypothetical protein BCU71_10025 [Vibrio lentus]|uniref:hypothetical protein n=1 Tax=Vibrio lentus TaxID=136468 RepID=UPI000C81A378|nr:hypothetical protein [Vibrio lentus]PMH23512.1 hypothetical protein BCU71_10025 [Vibrio lentus]PMK64539.1 hypothetical protein BCT93_09205 [Vibrio lentus]
MKVSNPLTIIAIFAGVAEAFATGSLVFLPVEIQSIFVYFVMIFPMVIVLAFFLILVKKPQVLYAPSDYSDETNFITANGIEQLLSAKTDQIVESVKREAPELNSKAINKVRTTLKSSFQSIAENNFENLVVNYLKEHRETSLTTTAISDALSIGFRSVSEALVSCKNKGLVQRTINPKTEIVLWKIKI